MGLLPFYLLALLLSMTGCKSNDDIIFDHERQQFETRNDRILLEFIAPFGTTADEELYIVGAFNGTDVEGAEPKLEQYKLTKAPNSNQKWGIYLDPSTFAGGKTLADGFRFYSATQGLEYTVSGELATHTDNPAVGSFTNIWGQRWEAYYWEGGEAPEPDHNGIRIYVDDQTGWDALNLYMWGDVNDLNGGWPGMSPTGTYTHEGMTWKYFDMGEENTDWPRTSSSTMEATDCSCLTSPLLWTVTFTCASRQREWKRLVLNPSYSTTAMHCSS